MWFFRHHKNFIKLYGFCFSPLAIAMKYYESGSLNTFLHKRKPSDDETVWNSELILHFSHNIVSAIKSLHNTGIVHSDLKPENLLVDVDEKGKYFLVLADLGISSIVNVSSLNIVKSFRTVKILGASAPFAAPEVFQRLRQDGHVSIDSSHVDVLKAADTYAFSITLWEMITKRKAWKQVRTYEGIETRVLSGERPEFPEETQKLCSEDKLLAGLVKIVAFTWCQDPLARWSMSQVSDELQQLCSKDSTWELEDQYDSSQTSTRTGSNDKVKEDAMLNLK
jgi:mitogen-activated protein kinase kinase kinase